jgi:tryptophan synthase beta chain
MLEGMVSNYLNLNAYFDYRIFPSHSEGGMPSALMSLETERNAMIPIPAEVLRVYSRFRPTPLFRASRFEDALGTTCQIFIKDESATPTGNHKANSSYAIAYLCASDGIRELTTETTGNWGVALSMAAKEFGLESLCFLDETSDTQRPQAKNCIKEHGGKVVIVKGDNHHRDLLQLSADAAIEATRQLTDAAYIFGSVYGYFVVPQSIMGLEARQQLASLGKYPDVVVGSCGGGANLLGIAAPFLVDRLTNASEVRVVSAESEKCPILSCGRPGVYSVDSGGYYPSIATYGLDGLIDDEYIGGLGSTIVASAAAHFHREKLIEAYVLRSTEALQAAHLFWQTEGVRVALETAYQLAAVVRESKLMDQGVILANISSGRNDSLFYTAE